ncbi:MAG TPA: transporter [Candidatus Accumulibacter sp.]|uniref:ion channel n=1 Tax=Accumulibacter sp. TaxID=2053492 RepID=UPI000EBB9103|nr:ion channel [Accumulibacter sp.]HCZ17450.1 transporter [Accumulibacter sp.]HRD93878.1 ion channel [Accumulibacter sp.]
MTFMNLAVGLPTMLLCLVLQASVTFWSVRYYMRQSARRLSRQGILAGVRPLLVVMIIMMAGNFTQMAVWGAIFVGLGEFDEFYQAVYHSAVNFTSLGYGDVVMSQQWKLLGPLEAANGVLMFGITSAALMAVLQHLIKAHLTAGDEHH